LQGSPSQNLAGVAVFASVFVSIMGGGTSTSFAGIQSIGALEDVYITHSELGSGKYAKCFEAEARHAQGEIVAIKSMYKSHKYFKKSRVIEEISAWQGLRHKNVVRLLAAYEDPTAIWMVQELCGGGDLQSRLRNTGPLVEEVARGITRQLFCTVTYMHTMRVTHRDIKPANVLMVSDDPSSLSYNDVKLCDFGLAHVGCAVASRPELQAKTMSTLCGSPSYLAPEVAWYVIEAQRRKKSRDNYGEVKAAKQMSSSRRTGSSAQSVPVPSAPAAGSRTCPATPLAVAASAASCCSCRPRGRDASCDAEASYTCLVDVWSVGVLMYETIAGCHPFTEWGDLLRGQLDLEGPLWSAVLPAASDCIRHVLVPNFLNRPTASVALLHPWLASGSPSGASRSMDSVAQSCSGSRLTMRQHRSRAGS